MGIPNSAFRSGDLYIEYGFESVLFRYEHDTARYFRKFYRESREVEVPHDSELLCDATCSGVLTTAERYHSGDAPVADPTADRFSRVAVSYQRIRPYWLSVMHRRDYACSGDVEVGADGGLQVVGAADSVKELLESAISDINTRPCLEVTCADGAPITVDRKTKDYDLGLRLELKSREFTVIAESSFYRGRSRL